MDSKKTILLVEDEVLIAMSEKMALEEYGYAVQTVNTGEKAVAAVRSSPEIDLILMDINLGKGIDGTQAAEIVLKDHDIPVVFLSSHTSVDVVGKTEKITSYGYVVKNSGITVLDASIKMAFKLFEANNKTKIVNEKLEATFDALPDLIFEIGLDGYYYDSHSSHDELLYKPLDDLLGKRVSDVLPADVTDIIMSAVAEAHEKGISSGKQYELDVPAGRRSFEITVSRIACFPDKPHFILLCHDITERIKVQETLHKSEEKYRLQFLYMNSYNSMYEVINDEEGKPKDFRFVMVNQAYEKYVGKKASDLIGKTLLEVYPETEQYWIDKMVEAVLTESPLQLEAYSKEMNFFTEISLYTPQKGYLAMTTANITERKKAELLLKASESRWSSLVNCIPDFVSVVDKDNNILFLNHYAEGFSEKDVVGISVFEFFLPESREIFRNGIIECRKTKKVQYLSHTAMGDKKSMREYEDYIVCLSDNNGAPNVMVVSRDITERKKTEKDLRESEQRYKTILETAIDGYWLTDTQGNILDINESYCNMSGYSKKELLGMRISDIVAEDTTIEISKRIQRIIKNSSERFESSHYRKDGSIMHVDVSVHYLAIENNYIVSVFRDITDLKKTEKALQESSSQFNLFMDFLPAVAFLKDSNGRTLFTNKYMDTILGSSGWKGKTMTEVFPNAFGEKLLAEDMNILTSGYRNIEETMTHLDGSIHTYETHKFKIKKLNGDSLIGGISLDITKRKLAEEKVESLLAEKELILKEVHHRIKNNMNTISSLLLLKEQGVNDSSAISALIDARSKVHGMEILYNKLYQAHSFTNVLIKDYLSTLVNEVLSNFPNCQLVKVDQHIDDFPLDAKQLQPLGIIINELLTNIMKYAFTGRESGLIMVTASSSEGRVVVSVQDDGNGIPESVNFENSTGFGLQLVQALTQQLDGTIRIERGNGTKIILEFEEWKKSGLSPA